MQCPVCTKTNTKVLDSRIPCQEECGYILTRGHRAFGWWSDEFRMRRRLCNGCSHRWYTIEVNLDDLENCIKDARTDRPTQPPQQSPPSTV